MSCERTLSGGRVRQSTQERQLRKSWRALDGTGIQSECHIQVTACHRNARVLHRLGSEPAEGINDVAVDHHLKMKVAAGGGARRPTEGYDVAADDLLADLDA